MIGLALVQSRRATNQSHSIVVRDQIDGSDVTSLSTTFCKDGKRSTFGVERAFWCKVATAAEAAISDINSDAERKFETRRIRQLLDHRRTPMVLTTVSTLYFFEESK